MESWRYNPSNFNLSIKRSWVVSMTLWLLYLPNILWEGGCVGLGAGVVALQYNLLPQARTKPRPHRHPTLSLVNVPTDLSRLAQTETLLLENYTGFEVLVAMTMMIKASLWSGDGAAGTSEVLVLHLPNDTTSHPSTELWRLKVVVLCVSTTRILVHYNQSFGRNSWTVLKKEASGSSATLVTVYNNTCCYNTDDSLSYQTLSLKRSLSLSVWMFRLKSRWIKQKFTCRTDSLLVKCNLYDICFTYV
jgi:hypothetical protein